MEVLQRAGLWPVNEIKDDGEVVTVYGDLEYVRGDGFYWNGRRVTREEWLQLVMLYDKFSEYGWWIQKLAEFWGLFKKSKVVPFTLVSDGVFIKNGCVLVSATFTTPFGWIIEPVDGVRFDLGDKKYVGEEVLGNKFLIVNSRVYGHLDVWAVEPVGDGFSVAVKVDSSELDGSCGHMHYLVYGFTAVDFICTKEPLRNAYRESLAKIYDFRKAGNGEYRITGGRKLFRGRNYVSVGERLSDVPEGWFAIKEEYGSPEYFRYVGNYLLFYKYELKIINAVGKTVFHGEGEDLLGIFSGVKTVDELFFMISML